MASIASFEIVNGTVGKDPEVAYTTNGKPMATLALAHNEKWKDQNGRQQERAYWFNVRVYGKMAEIAGQYLRKGSRVFCSGRLSTSQYEKNGQKVYSTDFTCDKLVFLSSPPQQQNSGTNQAPPQNNPPYQQNHSQQPPPQSNQHNAPSYNGGEWTDGYVQDDIPF